MIVETISLVRQPFRYFFFKSDIRRIERILDNSRQTYSYSILGEEEEKCVHVIDFFFEN